MKQQTICDKKLLLIFLANIGKYSVAKTPVFNIMIILVNRLLTFLFKTKITKRKKQNIIKHNKMYS